MRPQALHKCQVVTVLLSDTPVPDKKLWGLSHKKGTPVFNPAKKYKTKKGNQTIKSHHEIQTQETRVRQSQNENESTTNADTNYIFNDTAGLYLQEGWPRT